MNDLLMYSRILNRWCDNDIGVCIGYYAPVRRLYDRGVLGTCRLRTGGDAIESTSFVLLGETKHDQWAVSVCWPQCSDDDCSRRVSVGDEADADSTRCCCMPRDWSAGIKVCKRWKIVIRLKSGERTAYRMVCTHTVDFHKKIILSRFLFLFLVFGLPRR